MTVIIDGTTGITTPAETAVNITYTGTLTGGTGVVNLGSGQVYKDASGNVGIGTASPAAKLDVQGGTRAYGIASFDGATYAAQDFKVAGTHKAYISTANAVIGGGSANDLALDASAGNLILATGDTERARIDSSGNLLVAKTTGTAAGINTGSIQGGKEIMSCGSTAGICWENRSGGVTSNSNWYMWYNTGGTNYLYNGAGNIASINGSTGAYTALSDAAKKKDFEDATVGLAEILQLRPRLFRMLDDADDAPKQLGFIAQEVQPFIPQAYVKSEGSENQTFIGLQDRPIIAALTKAIQEQQTLITALTARITALEAANV